MINNLNDLSTIENSRLIKAHKHMQGLIGALNTKEIPDEVAVQINEHIAAVNAFSGTEKERMRATTRKHNAILALVQKTTNLVPKSFYQTLGMSIGMTAFGVPLGVALGVALDNMAFMAVFMPVGMAIGIGIGAGMDNKAAKEGRVLEY